MAMARTRARGFTLIEVLAVAAVAGVLLVAAWPSQRAQIERARRTDAVAALMRVQFAQEQYRANHGLYSATLATLQGAGSARSPEGHYDIAIEGAQGEAVVIAAAARGAQAGDRECARLTLSLNQGLADYGPSSRCWNR
jgi:type IV pilus assembly protein PilE